MASRDLNLIVRMRDEASRELQGLSGKIDQMQPAFRKMAMIGTAAFAGLSVGIGKAIQEAGDAEKIATNFEGTFGKSSKVIGDFIEDFGDKFAFVESEMKDGANSIGFQLSAMGGISEEETEKMTKSLLTASAGLSDFFGGQMNVTDASRAMAKGLSGNRQQLIDMGFNVLEEDLKDAAEAMGMNLDEMTKLQEAELFTQMIMDQTKTSREGLNKTMETFTGQQRAVRKATKETAQTLGEVFIPMATDLLKKIKPIIESIAEWIEENPELIRNIILISGALAGLIAGVGLLGMILPTIITGFSLLIGPIGLALGILGALVVVFLKNKDVIMSLVTVALEKLKKIWSDIQNPLSVFINVLKQLWNLALKALMPLFDDMWKALGDLWEEFNKLWKLISPYVIPVLQTLALIIVGVVYVALIGFIAIITKLITWLAKFQTIIMKIVTFITKNFPLIWKIAKKVFKGMVLVIKEATKEAFKIIKDTWNNIVDFYKDSWDKIISTITSSLSTALDLITSVWKAVRDFFSHVWTTISETFTGVIDTITGTIGGWLDSAWDNITDIWGNIKEFFQDIWDGIAKIFIGGVNVVIGAIEGLINKVISGLNLFVDKVNWIIDQINSLPGMYFRPIKGLSRIELPKLPELAEGGIVKRPTTALIGEEGPEAVVPLNKMGTGGGNVYVTVRGDVSGDDLIEKVKRSISIELNREIGI